MGADDARELIDRTAGMMMQILEGALTEFSTAIAAQFTVPQRDVLHLLTVVFCKSCEAREENRI